MRLPSCPFGRLLPKPTDFDTDFYAPITDLVGSYSREAKEDLTLPDMEFVKLGVQRCLGAYDSGRHFLQELSDDGRDLPRATFFHALQDPRRLRVLAALCAKLAQRSAALLAGVDWLAQELPGLGPRPVFAVDGHHIEHACHALRDGKDRHTTNGTLYALNLRTGIIEALALHSGNGRRMHEIKALKKVLKSFLDRAKGRGRPIIVGDMAYVDNTYWPRHRFEDKDAPDLITREKENMRPMSAIALPIDRTNPVNAHVIASELVGFGNGFQQLRVTYRDPEKPADQEPLVFLCTDTKMQPGEVAILYQLRWKIEKTYHTYKSKLHERKAWATGPIAQEIQSHLITVTHNLLTLLLHKLDKDHGIREEKVLKKHDKREKARALQGLPDLIFYRIARKALQQTHQFIRLVSHVLGRKRPWHELLPLFRMRLTTYL